MSAAAETVAASAPARFPEFVEDRALYVQLTPTMPDTDAPAVIQGARYGSQWIRLRRAVPAADVAAWAAECAAAEGTSAVYLAVPQPLLTTELMQIVLPGTGFQFWAHLPATDELVWYRWVHPTRKDMVPKRATSIEGGGCVVLSPDETQALVVWEYGRWNRVGGAVDPGESCLETATREAVEETAVQLDDDWTPLVGMAYNQPCSRDAVINDHFILFVLKALSTDVQPDGTEIQRVLWLDVDAAVAAFRALPADEPTPYVVEVNGEPVASMVLLALSRFRAGEAAPASFVDARYAKPRLML